MNVPRSVVTEKNCASNCYYYFLRLESGTWDTGKDIYERSVLIGLDDPGIEGRDHAIEPEGFEMSFDFSNGHIHGFISFFLFYPMILVLLKGSLACAEHEVAPRTYRPGPGWILEWVGLHGRSRVPTDPNQTR